MGPLGRFRNENVNFGQKSRVLKAKKVGVSRPKTMANWPPKFHIKFRNTDSVFDITEHLPPLISSQKAFFLSSSGVTLG